jgi:hypothetical protein
MTVSKYGANIANKIFELPQPQDERPALIRQQWHKERTITNTSK